MFFFVNWSIYDEVQARLPKEQAIPSATRTVRQRIQYVHFWFRFISDRTFTYRSFRLYSLHAV